MADDDKKNDKVSAEEAEKAQAALDQASSNASSQTPAATNESKPIYRNIGELLHAIGDSPGLFKPMPGTYGTPSPTSSAITVPTQEIVSPAPDTAEAGADSTGSFANDVNTPIANSGSTDTAGAGTAGAGTAGAGTAGAGTAGAGTAGAGTAGAGTAGAGTAGAGTAGAGTAGIMPSAVPSIGRQYMQGGSKYTPEDSYNGIASGQIEAKEGEISAVDAAAQASKEAVTNQGIIQQQYFDDQQKRETERKNAEAIMMQNNDAINADIQKRIADVKDIDPDRRSTPMKVLGAIAMGLGAFGAGMTHSRNFAMDIINEGIANDVNAQKANIEKQWKTINEQYKLKDDQRIKDQFIIEQQSRAMQFEKEKMVDRINFEAAKSGSAEAQARAAVMIASLKGDIANIQKDRLDRGIGFQQQETNAAHAGAVASNTRAKELEKRWQDVYMGALKEYGHDKAKAYANDAVYGQAVPGNAQPVSDIESLPKEDRARAFSYNGDLFLAKDAEAAKEAKIAVDSAKEVLNINNRIRALMAQPGILSIPKRAELNGLLNSGALHYPRMQTGSARINDVEIKMGQKTYDDNDWINRGDMFGNKKGALKVIDDQANQRIQDAIAGAHSVGGRKAIPTKGKF